MKHDYQWHRSIGRRRRPRGAASVALMLAVGVIGGLAVERLVPGDRLSTGIDSMSPATSERATSGQVTPRAATFGLCHRGGGDNCVVDGDTFWMAGEKIRIADIDTPETHPARCAAEADLGGQATRRLQALLNAGAVTLAIGDRDTDRYGRKLRIVERNGVSLGDTLVAEGLARRWTGRRLPWCDV